MELVNASDVKRNKIVPVPHPEFKEDWHGTLSLSIDNLLVATRYFPLWMFRARLNFTSHEPIHKYVYYGLMAFKLATPVRKAVKRLDEVLNIQKVAMD